MLRRTTADRIRHDIDRLLPRTPQEIFESNTMMVDKMLEVIPKDIPIVPSLGNNDIYPHNVLAAGPNRITEHFLGYVSYFDCVLPAELTRQDLEEVHPRRGTTCL
jgi:energy-converting hydrogenase Eha subunit A